jgi:AraC-like DNA-binding protein
MADGGRATGAPAVWQQARFSPVKLAAAVAVLGEAGVPSGPLLAGTGLTPADLDDPDVLTSPAQLYEVLRRGEQACPQPGIGLAIGQRLRITGYGMYGYALLCAPTMRAGLELAMRYHALANPLVPLRSVATGGAQVWRFPDARELALPGLTAGLHRLLIEMQMAIHLTLARDVMGPWCVPSQVSFAWPAPPHAAQVARTFGCPVHWNQAQGDMRYPLEWLDRAPQLANAITAAQASRECARLIAGLAGEPSVSRRVCDELMRTPGQFPDIGTMAATLGLTDRTLRRHLHREGTSFSALLADVRRALAEDYLRSTRMSIEDIGAALAFDNARSFRQAFGRWTGRSPTEYRRGH